MRRIDALLNVAAVFVRSYQKTPDGFEHMLATNYFGPFLLTNMLRDRLLGGGRVITVAAPSTTRVSMERLFSKKRNSRDAHVRRHKGPGPDVHVRAGQARKPMGRASQRIPTRHRPLRADETTRPGLSALARLLSRSPDRAGEDLADLAISPAHAGTTGWFFKGSRRTEPPRSVTDAV